MVDNLKASEISELLLKQLHDIDIDAQYEEVGQVLQVHDGVVRLHGLSNAEAGELLEFDSGVMAVVMNLEEDNVGAVLLGSTEKVKEGMTARRTGRISYSFWAPNAFSPNDDNKNDKFYVFPDTVTHREIDVATFELNVFSRNGQLVFHTRDMNEGWNGRIQNSGAVLPPGVYIYTIRFKKKDGSPKYQKGTITLLK